MTTEILKENVLTDDIICFADKGKQFKGGYFAYIEYYTFLNSWGDQKHIKMFKSRKSLGEYLKVNYNEFYISNY